MDRLVGGVAATAGACTILRGSCAGSLISQWFRSLDEQPGGGAGPNLVGLFDAVVNWVENGVAPDTLLASRDLGINGPGTS